MMWSAFAGNERASDRTPRLKVLRASAVRLSVVSKKFSPARLFFGFDASHGITILQFVPYVVRSLPRGSVVFSWERW